MNLIRKKWWLAPLTAVLVVAGCSDNGVKPATQMSTDQTVITGTLAASPQFLDDGYMDVSTPTSLAPSLSAARGPSGAAGLANEAIDPLYFWRTITQRSRTFEFAFADTDSTGLPTTAVVTLNRRLVGAFNVIPRDPQNPGFPDTSLAVHKPLDDRWVRRFLMKRVSMPGMSEPTWRLAAASAIEVTSLNAATAITSVRVQSSTVDTTLTDPAAFIRLRRVLRFDSQDTVHVTVTTPRTDDVVFLYHHDRRERLANNGDGTYSGRFRAGYFNGWRHFAVNALSHGTLYDDAAPYDSKAWIYPYVVIGGPSVDYLP